MILTLPVLAYQLLFVLVLYVASRFGRTALTLAMLACLLWTATHLFLLPLMALQAVVILVTYVWLRGRTRPSAPSR